jgi:hypothetical protein
VGRRTQSRQRSDGKTNPIPATFWWKDEPNPGNVLVERRTQSRQRSGGKTNPIPATFWWKDEPNRPAVDASRQNEPIAIDTFILDAPEFHTFGAAFSPHRSS